MHRRVEQGGQYDGEPMTRLARDRGVHRTAKKSLFDEGDREPRHQAAGRELHEQRPIERDALAQYPQVEPEHQKCDRQHGG